MEGNIYQNLGSKTFWYLFSKNSVTGFVFLVTALILSITRSQFTGNVDMASFARSASWVSFVIAIISLVVAVIVTKLVYKNTGFILSHDALLIRHGVFTKEEFAIPYRQIQNIEIERTLGDQIMGISKLIILTAGLENSEEEKKDDPEGVIPVIDHKVAVLLQGELLKRAK